MKTARIATALVLGATAISASAQISDDVVRIGFISDMSGIYRDYDGPAGAEAIRMAIADLGGVLNGKKIELLTADHQNKPDIAAAKAREWFDVNKVDMLIGGVNSGAAIAMAGVAADKKKPFFVVGSGASSLTNEFCSPYTVHYAYDTVAMARGTASAVVKSGGKSWYFVAADYAFGAALQNDASKVILANGGTVAGSVKHPLGASDFSSFMLQAQGSNAQVLALANAGGDTVNALKSAAEFGLSKNMKLAGMIITINDVHALGLKTAQNMYLTDSWYWNQTPESREWARRFFDKHKRMPSSFHAGDYSAAVQYLKAVKAAGTDDADTVMAQLKKSKFEDMFVKGGWLRGDGLMVHDMQLMQVKTPAESSEPWDYYKVVERIKGEAAWTTKAESRCARWKV
ncbi:ABC transporter substrate-binding protein [Variovorax sp. J22G21]|uniref:ABC transporter substrate-binding protein n=1 Tax=Variovorax fucosicus TaxID=3053517 RepID=UPI002578E15D|nr:MULTISPECIES: ABC transporter substrate-binding protein [unclassified Variovorax]MDM0037762.1 ABC transporter substrate-binding protein [Variovorax sp. J22R193]MDM0062538.1 ABC transporter substrate-binding protein [Variovorax sp. J22G21]